MAKVGFFGRLANLWRGFISIWISDVEKKHPEIAYENAINSMIEKYTQLKKATAAIIRRREELQQRLDAKTKELTQTEAELNTALETNQQDLGMILIQKQKALQEETTSLHTELDQASKDADSAKASLVQVQSEIKKLKAEKDAQLAKMASAQARIRIQEQLEGLSVDNEVKALEGVRESIKNTVAQASLQTELNENDVDARLAKLRQQTGDVTAKSEWERMQAARAAKAQQAQGGGTGGKTM
jgi:phage shock protein A